MANRTYHVFLYSEIEKAQEEGREPEPVAVSAETMKLTNDGTLYFVDYYGNYTMAYNRFMWAWVTKVTA